jgi:preprotein translocase subunit SecA
VDRYLDEDFGPASFADFASTRLSVDYEAHDFRKLSFEEAQSAAREKASRAAPAFFQEALDECLNAEEDPKEWKWQELSRRANARYALKTTDRELKQMGRDGVIAYLQERAVAAIDDVDLKDGEKYLTPDWGLRSLCDWMRQKFLLKVAPEELAGKPASEIKRILHKKVMDQYRQKEIEFPVTVAMANFMSERPTQPGAQKYDRGGLLNWARVRFPHAAESVSEEDFRTLSRNKLYELLLNLSRQSYPEKGHDAIDEKLDEAFEGTRHAEAEDAAEVCNWARETLKLEIDPEQLAGKSQDEARQVLWTAFDSRYRPEMRGMERSLYLSQLDAAWKKHLLTMDHLRSTVGLAGFGQEDPKIVYKREGMKEFEQMKDVLEDRVTDTIFRMEEEEGFQESIWSIAAATKESFSAHQNYTSPDGDTATNAASDKKKEPIRNRNEKVGRNDPCPCGSGKKYKNCCMRTAASR